MNTLSAQTAYVGSTEIKQVRLGSELVLAPNGNELWYKSNELPSLDLRFAEDKSLVDATTGSNLVDFTRASSATYVGSDGLIKTAVTNLVLQSEDFSTTWTAGNATITANNAIAPNGTLTADLYAGTSTSSVSQSVAVTSGAVYTISFYVKSAGLGNDTFRLLIDGTQTSPNYTATSQWQRFTFTATSANTASRTCGIVRDSLNNAVNIYIWGAQLEQSSTVGEYVPTTSTINSAPRFDHDPTTGESLGLLVEESRTNLLLSSEEFNTTWTLSDIRAFGSGSVVDAAVAPNGQTTADLLTENNQNAIHSTNQAVSITSGLTYTFSCFIKRAGGSRNAVIQVRTVAFGAAYGVNLDLSTGVASARGGVTIFDSKSYGNGWWRVWLTATATSTVSSFVDIGLLDGTTLSYQGDDASGIYLWGAQLEEGSFPTSYIPTTSSTVTRSADVASISGSNFSGWYRQDEGTVFMGFRTIADNPNIFSVSDGGFSNRHQAYMNNSNVIVRTSALGVASNNGLGTALLNQNNKAAFAFSPGTTSGSLSGNINTTTQAIPNNLDVAYFGASANGTVGNPVVLQRITFWPARLPNDTLQTITQ